MTDCREFTELSHQQCNHCIIFRAISDMTLIPHHEERRELQLVFHGYVTAISAKSLILNAFKMLLITRLLLLS